MLKVSWKKSGEGYTAGRLREVFSEFGEVEDVVISFFFFLSTPKLKGKKNLRILEKPYQTHKVLSLTHLRRRQ
jgi:hypothetical protein